MDSKTLTAYSEKAESYSDDWLSQPEPSDMYDLLKKYFVSNGTTVDIGCGNGRDANWLMQNGFRVSGFDSSKELIDIGSRLYPGISFGLTLLPEMKEITVKYDNVLCETVIMHLPKGRLQVAIQNLKRILKPNGVLYLSWRVTEGEDARHGDGRLYSAFTPEFILEQFDKKGVLHFEDKISASSGKRVCRLIYKNC